MLLMGILFVSYFFFLNLPGNDDGLSLIPQPCLRIGIGIGGTFVCLYTY